MALSDKYLITTKNLEAFLNAIQTAKAPEHFTAKFLNDLEFTSSNDRLLIGVLKGLQFIDESGAPTAKYFSFLDQSQSGKVLAAAIREAYGDLFAVNTKANLLDVEQVRNKLKTLTQGQRSEKVISLMANTFVALCSLADWSDTPSDLKPTETNRAPDPVTHNGDGKQDVTGAANHATRPAAQLHYNIQIHLPDSRDPAVFDAIFQSLRKHLV